MATLVEKVRSLTGSGSTQTADADIVNGLNIGVRYVIGSVPKSLLAFMATDSSSITGSSGCSISNDFVLGVTRNNVECDEIPKEMAYGQRTDWSFTSLFKASTFFPKFYIRSGKVYVKPDPTSSQPAKVQYIDVPTLSSTTVSHNLSDLEHPIVLYAAALDSINTASYWNKKTLEDVDGGSPTVGQDALDKAQALIDNSTALSNGQDAEYYISDEDTEMVESILRTAAQEINRAATEIERAKNDSSLKSLISPMVAQYVQQADLYFKQASEAVQLYVGNNEKMLSLKLAAQKGQNNG